MWRRKVIVMCAVWASFPAAASSIGTQTPKSKDGGGTCDTPECVHAASWILGNVDTNVDPCTDFYSFACGNLMRSPRRPDETYPRELTYMAKKELDARLRSIVEGIDKKTAPKPFRLIKILYDNCMSVGEYIFTNANYNSWYRKLRAPGGWPVIAGYGWNDKSVDNTRIARAFLNIKFNVDPKNTTRRVPWVSLANRGLDPEILRMGRNNDIVRAYYSFMVDTAVLMGANKARAEYELNQALILDIELALDGVPEADRWILGRTLDRMTVDQLVRKHPKLNLRQAMHAVIPSSYNLTENDVVVVDGNIGRLEEVLARTSKRAVVNLMIWRNVMPMTETLSLQLRERSRHFARVRFGNVATPVQWKRCVNTVRSKLGLSLSALYQRTYMSQNIVEDITQMSKNVKRQFYEIVEKAEWLDEVSRKEALKKIDNMMGEVFYRAEYLTDKKLEDFYEKLELTEGNYGLNLRNITTFVNNASRESLRNAIDRDNWTIFGDFMTLGAAYLTWYNHYFLSHLFTVKNFYHIDRPKYINYATLGWPISHEISHSLDTIGIYMDQNATLREWWPLETKKKFDERAECIVEQYGNYTAWDVNLKLHGYRLAAENIADVAGIQTAYHAYLKWASENDAEKKLPGLSYTPQQMFWISAGTSWCAKLQTASLRNSVMVDAHSPPMFRANAVFANRPEFANDFKCRRGSGMNPVKKCSLW